ncbi:MAG: phosphoribosylformylglycinamidine cyclo-ligase [Bacillota bacterium]|nr:phosphoribosylformylglycinamidine cyclo-ligase [Bacillota bacterium]
MSLYEEAGVDRRRAARAIEKVKEMARATYTPQVLEGIGGFAARFRRPGEVLHASCDGVGTKILLAREAGLHQTTGWDAVAMVVNDLLASRSLPLFLLDYVAMGRLEGEVLEDIFRGVTLACQEAGCALIGGETAELPDLLPSGHYDVVAFGVGMETEGGRGESPQAGDVLLGLPSSGLHSNGFSLVRKILSADKGSRKDGGERVEGGPGAKEGEGSPLVPMLLTPTRIYRKSLEPILRHPGLTGLAHITGGGLFENVPRMLPPHLRGEIWEGTWPLLPVYRWLLQELGKPLKELAQVFNGGLGMVLSVRKEALSEIQKGLLKAGEASFVVGQVAEGPGGLLWREERP